jgi:hypothetical protein
LSHSVFTQIHEIGLITQRLGHSLYKSQYFEAAGVPDGLDPSGVKITLGGGWGDTDQARYDDWVDLFFTDSTVLA